MLGVILRAEVDNEPPERVFRGECARRAETDREWPLLPVFWKAVLSLTEMVFHHLFGGNRRNTSGFWRRQRLFTSWWCSDLAGRLGNGTWKADSSLESSAIRAVAASQGDSSPGMAWSEGHLAPLDAGLSGRCQSKLRVTCPSSVHWL